eukprot:CAMPEP_0201523978 /NCGR_PEP_ID=MMETSP0161_2-20130828/21037_1 /ASSEMBLY_ACC=CAM_ASM_000251 /TAXON_ID=180227 /ORGANISM="Neoparamoeba aestuarina, Strain SoJaBio B1-5/56/2" /LENGTH=264 /DNA_ID=CAMNT_0047923225 /DNA_START=20 /DNA_END=814 /DNA_ORIENTATION=+
MTMITLLCVDCDAGCGKVEKSLLSQQTLMELLIAGVDAKEKLCRNTDDSVDISHWHHLTVNAQGDVTEIEWDDQELSGYIDFQWLPETLEGLTISSEGHLSGEVDLTRLPCPLIVFQVYDNAFSGKVNLCHLPEKLEILSISGKGHTGTPNLRNLPRSMRRLHLNDCSLTGEVDLTQLPPLLEALSLAENQLSGPVDLTRLPQRMERLNLNDNRFSGLTDFSKIPRTVDTLSVAHTDLSGEVYIFTGIYLEIRGSKVKYVGSDQ